MTLEEILLGKLNGLDKQIKEAWEEGETESDYWACQKEGEKELIEELLDLINKKAISSITDREV